MSDINKTVADEIVQQLKSKNLISADQKDLETKISNGYIKENEWKLIFEQQIKTLETQSEDETK
jgi:hypothetical protein